MGTHQHHLAFHLTHRIIPNSKPLRVTQRFYTRVVKQIIGRNNSKAPRIQYPGTLIELNQTVEQFMPQGIVENNRIIDWQLVEVTEGYYQKRQKTTGSTEKEIKEALMKPLPP